MATVARRDDSGSPNSHRWFRETSSSEPVRRPLRPRRKRALASWDMSIYRCFLDIKSKCLPVNGGDYLGGHPRVGDKSAVQRGSAPWVAAQAESSVEEAAAGFQSFHVC